MASDNNTEIAKEESMQPSTEPKIEVPSRTAPDTLSSPPNGGLVAWLHVMGGFFLFFNTWGLLNTFGVFQTYYASGALFYESSSNISWIGSVQSYMIFTIGFISGPIFDRGYFRTLVISGSLLIVFALMMLSICKEYWQVLLAQGFCLGIGAGCLFVPCVAVLPGYFSTKLGLAIGLASSGSSLGGVIYPIVLYQLIDQIGFGWSVRVIGFIVLGTLLIPITVMKQRVKPPKPRALIDWSAFIDMEFVLFAIATLIGFIGLVAMLFYISFYPANKHIVDSRLAFYMVPIFNAASILGRTVPNWVSDKTGPLNVITPGAIIFGVLNFCMIAVSTEAAMIVIALLTGFFSGIYIALPPVCFVVLTKDKSKIGTRVGMGFGIIGFGVLIGGPGAGAILGSGDTGPLNWTGFWAFAGACCCVSGIMYAVLRFIRTGPKLMTKG